MIPEDKHYCPSCWDRRTSPAPERCRNPHQHAPSTAIKIGVVIEHADGSKTHIASDQFDWVDIDLQREQIPFPDAWDLYRTVPLGRMNLTIRVHNVGKYMIQEPQPKPQPSIDDGNVVEES